MKTTSLIGIIIGMAIFCISQQAKLSVAEEQIRKAQVAQVQDAIKNEQWHQMATNKIYKTEEDKQIDDFLFGRNDSLYHQINQDKTNMADMKNCLDYFFATDDYDRTNILKQIAPHNQRAVKQALAAIRSKQRNEDQIEAAVKSMELINAFHPDDTSSIPTKRLSETIEIIERAAQTDALERSATALENIELQNRLNSISHP